MALRNRLSSSSEGFTGVTCILLEGFLVGVHVSAVVAETGMPGRGGEWLLLPSSMVSASWKTTNNQTSSRFRFFLHE